LVKLEEIPSEGERVDLQHLPRTNVLKAVSEEFRQATATKTGGLVITFRTKNGKQFPQKYSKISGKALAEALKRLGLKDTKELQEAWYEYELTSFRTGFPRYIPVRRAK